MSNQLIRAVLFDYGGVIADEGFRNGLLALAREQGLEVDTMLDAARRAVYDSGFVLGRGTAGDFWQLMREGAGLEGGDSALTGRILRGFVLRAWVIRLVQQLNERGYITGILSDQMHWLDWLDERDHFYQYFDHIFNSYYIGKGKRDPGLFNDVAEQLSLSPAEILFVDDIENNVARAQAAGWQASHYVDKARLLASIDGLLREGKQEKTPD